MVPRPTRLWLPSGLASGEPRPHPTPSGPNIREAFTNGGGANFDHHGCCEAQCTLLSQCRLYMHPVADMPTTYNRRAGAPTRFKLRSAPSTASIIRRLGSCTVSFVGGKIGDLATITSLCWSGSNGRGWMYASDIGQGRRNLPREDRVAGYIPPFVAADGHQRQDLERIPWSFSIPVSGIGELAKKGNPRHIGESSPLRILENHLRLLGSASIPPRDHIKTDSLWYQDIRTMQATIL
ncbi:hypothetical protein F5146DRAFT_1118794 [Armillaria mellea]|nr:hypothetical protein F5146DRAFT_1118794 [Armillaria mellea]